MKHDIENQQSWILLPPGDKAILRFPASEIPDGCRLATASDLITANMGAAFPWGSLPSPENASRLWKEQRIGYGGLEHRKWFIAREGRFGGADNVPQDLPGSLRSCLLYDGGMGECFNAIAENEGYAIVRENLDPANRDLYRRVQLHAAEHVAADGGRIILSPINESTGKVYVGFAGRCLSCPNPELVSFRQLKQAVSGYDFELFDEWKNWSLNPLKKQDFNSLKVS